MSSIATSSSRRRGAVAVPPARVRRPRPLRREGRDGVEVELCELGKSSASWESRRRTSARAAASDGGGSAEPRHEPARLPRPDELVGVDVGQGREPEVRVADQLGEHPAGAEGDERAEDGILRHSRQELDASRDHRLHDHGAADPLGSGTNGLGVGEVEGDAAASPSCAPPPPRSSRPRESRAPARLLRPPPASPRRAPERAGGRRRRGGSGCGRVEPGLVVVRERRRDHMAAAAASTPSTGTMLPAERRSHSPSRRPPEGVRRGSG